MRCGTEADQERVRDYSVHVAKSQVKSACPFEGLKDLQD